MIIECDDSRNNKIRFYSEAIKVVLGVGNTLKSEPPFFIQLGLAIARQIASRPRFGPCIFWAGWCAAKSSGRS